MFALKKAEGNALGDWLYTNFDYVFLGLLLNLLMLPVLAAVVWYVTQPRGARGQLSGSKSRAVNPGAKDRLSLQRFITKVLN